MTRKIVVGGKYLAYFGIICHFQKILVDGESSVFLYRNPNVAQFIGMLAA